MFPTTDKKKRKSKFRGGGNGGKILATCVIGVSKGTGEPYGTLRIPFGKIGEP